MATINWVNANASGVSSGGSGSSSALEQASRAFKRFDDSINAKRVLDAQKAKDQKVIDDRNKLLSNQRDAAAFRKAFFSNNEARLDTPSLIKALELNPAYRNASPKQRKEAKKEYLKSLGQQTIRQASVFSSAYEDYLRNQGIYDDKQIREKVSAAVKDTYPTSTKDIRDDMNDLLKLQFNTSNLGKSSSGRGKGGSRGKAISISESDKLLKSFQNTYKLPDENPGILDRALQGIGISTAKPSVASLSSAVALLGSNGYDATTVGNTIRQIMSSDGSVREGFDWNSQQGQNKLLDLAQSIKGSSPRSGSGSGYQTLPQEAVNKFLNVMNTANPHAAPDSSIVSSLVGFLPPPEQRFPIVSPLQEAPVAIPIGNQPEKTKVVQNRQVSVPQQQQIPQQQDNGILESIGKSLGNMLFDARTSAREARAARDLELGKTPAPLQKFDVPVPETSTSPEAGMDFLDSLTSKFSRFSQDIKRQRQK